MGPDGVEIGVPAAKVMPGERRGGDIFPTLAPKYFATFDENACT
jgi:hypothetical protein